MNCNEITEVINDYFDGNLSNEKKSDMEIHISDCIECKHKFASYSNLFERIKVLPSSIPAPKELTLKIIDDFTEKKETIMPEKADGLFDKLKSKILKK